VGRTKAELPPVPILKVKHDAFAGCVPRPASALLPEFRRLQLGEECFQGTRGVELFPHNRGHVLQHPPQQGQVGVDAAAHPSDVAAPKQQPVGWDLGFGGVIPKRHQHQS
jgi:hypothetical protein